MRAVALLDTSILLELLEVPGRMAQGPGALALGRELRRKRQDNTESLLLPLAAIIEAGNHIARLSDGRLRRRYAQKLVSLLKLALNDQAPFKAAVDVDPGTVGGWCSEFVEWVTPQAREFTDLTIKLEWTRQCRLHPGRRVYVWSLDDHLAGLERDPDLRP
jgi:hypothetical protein